MSWKKQTNELVGYVQGLKYHTLGEETYDGLLKRIEAIQKAIYDQYENPATTDEMDVTLISLESENAELKRSLENYREHYESRLADSNNRLSQAIQQAGRFKKRYKRAKDLLVNLTKFVGEMEDENEA